MNSQRLLQPLLRLNASAPARAFSSTPRAALARMNLIGRLGAEPELTATSTGRQLVRFSVGTSSGPRDARQTSWFRVTSFDEGPRRDLLLSLPKGTLIYVDAESRMRSYDDENGKKQYALDLVQRSFDVLSRPRADAAAEDPADAIEEGRAAASG